ncbi:leukotriene B4 receptor 1-like [Polypterus senegalus]|uniref:leukotriene B4 receptor 1-like n=1 Tax=Polypterus senegalus TaxID=55291 RepID=UPI001966959B|nr:leukotriene B4 receptor 1-like [Polypterus senegalus]
MNLSISSNDTKIPVPAGFSTSHIVGIFILVSAFVLGFPGNLFVAWTIIFRISQRSITCLLVLNLALADAFVLLTAPLFLRYLAGGQGWEFGNTVCKITHYVCCVNMYASIFLICVMSLDRYVAVVWPFASHHFRTRKSLVKILLILWALAFLFSIPMPFYRSELTLPTIKVKLCHFSHNNERHEVFQYLMESLTGFIIPFSVIIFCYINVFIRLRRAMFQNKNQSSRIILLIIAAFVVFWMPYHIVNIIQVAGRLNQGQMKEQLLQAARTARPNVTAFAFFSSSVNPMLYVFAGSSYIRSAGLNFMTKLFEGTYSEGTGSKRFSRSTRSTRSGSTDVSFSRKLSVFPVKFGKPDEYQDNISTKDDGVPNVKAVELKTLCTYDSKDIEGSTRFDGDCF